MNASLLLYFPLETTKPQKQKIPADVNPNDSEALSPEGRCEAYPIGVQLFLLMFYFVLVNVLWKKKMVIQVV